MKIYLFEYQKLRPSITIIFIEFILDLAIMRHVAVLNFRYKSLKY